MWCAGRRPVTVMVSPVSLPPRRERDRDGHDLGGEGVFRPGLGAELLAAQAEGVGVVAGDVPLLGDALGPRTASEFVVFPVPLVDGAAEALVAWSTPSARGSSARHRRRRRRRRHRFHHRVGQVLACCDEPHWVSTVVAGTSRADRRRARRCEPRSWSACLPPTHSRRRPGRSRSDRCRCDRRGPSGHHPAR